MGNHLRLVLCCTCLLLLCKTIYSIYVPNTSAPAKTKSAIEMKTLEWQNPETTTDRITVYQNYTNVNIQHHTNDDNLKQLYQSNYNRPHDVRIPNNEQSDLEPTASELSPQSYNNPGSYNPAINSPNSNNNRFSRKYVQNTYNNFESTTPRGDMFVANWYPTPPYQQTPAIGRDAFVPQQVTCTLNCRANPGNIYNPQYGNNYQPESSGMAPHDASFSGPFYAPTSGNTRTPSNIPHVAQGASSGCQTRNCRGGVTTYGTPIRGQNTQYFPQQSPNTRPTYQISKQPVQVFDQYPNQYLSQPSNQPRYQPHNFPNVIIPQNYYSGKLQNVPRQIQPYNNCPEGARGQYPYENSCNQFLNCWNGRGVVQNCAPGTLFNPETLECDFPTKVNCVSGPRTIRYEKLTVKKEAACPIGFSGIIPHYQDCSKFLNCDNGKQVEMNCPPGTLFDAQTNICDHAYKVQCVNEEKKSTRYIESSRYIRDPGTSTVSQYGEKPTTYQNIYQKNQFGNTEDNSGKLASQPIKCPAQFSGLMAHPTDCSKFLNCGNGMTYIQNCGPGTHYNPAISACDYIHNVKCESGQQNGQFGPGASQIPSGTSQQWTTTSQYPSNPQQSPDQHTSPNWHPPHSDEIRTPNGQTRYHNGYYNPAYLVTYQNMGNQGQPLPSSYQTPQTNLESNIGSEKNHNQNNEWDQTGPYANNSQKQENDFGDDDILDQQIEEVWNVHPQTTTPSSETLIISQTTNKRKQWPPPFPTNSDDEDYIFEEDDLIEPVIALSLPARPQDGNQNHKVPGILHQVQCGNTTYNCDAEYCIMQSFVCNGQKDCPNGDDEQNCSLRLKDFVKTAGTKLAVKENIKITNVTLAWCAATCAKNNCKGFNYRKHDGTCYILDSNVGTSGALIILPSYDYFENQKYTISCEHMKGYLCNNKKCIAKQRVCDGINDCGDGMDEKGCTADAFDYRISLVGGENQHSGRLQLQVFGRTGYICDDMFGLKNADVACRELGFSLGALEVRGNSFFAQDVSDNDTLYLMDDVTCMGNETSLRDCDFNGWGKNNCKPQEIVGVVCKTPVEVCPKDHWKCDNNLECLPLPFVCDGVYDCSDSSDEKSVLCDAPAKLRLTQGTRGRLEIMHNGIWGTICDDDFNDDAAKVVCRQLGYIGSAKVVKDGQFGHGSGPIWLDQVFCRGNESSLEECIHWDWGEHNCDHSEDVGVLCNIKLLPGIEKHQHNLDIMPDNSLNDKLPESCGLRSDAIFNNQDDLEGAHFRVVMAATARAGEYPWQASIKVKGKTKSAHWCGAIVISSKYILTAAHCLVGFSKGAYFIVAGDYNVDKDEGTEQEAYIEDFIIHPKFGHGNKMNNDIALVRLKGKGFNITKDVQPVCLPPADTPYPVGLNCTISGFGSIESGKSKASHNLRAGWIPILSKEVCKMPHVYGAAITDGMLCAGFMENGVDACDGDSGGPLACLHEGVFKLFGITSWGQHCGYANKPGVYVNVTKYRKWIEDTIKELSKN